MEIKLNWNFDKNELEKLDEQVNEILEKLTLDEKIGLLSGADNWHTLKIERLNLPALGMTDGPHGVRPKCIGGKSTTYFPVAICAASTWNPEKLRVFGKALGEETKSAGMQIILAPGINIARTPLNGRTFEYYSEDPFLIRKLVASFIQGVQSKNVAACVKHFVANNQETRRFYYDAQISERALREIYLQGFEAAIKEGDVWAVMSAYNRVNGEYMSENKHLLNDILMKEWNFNGFVVSDWGATRPVRKTKKLIEAGLTLEMPKAVKYTKKKILKAIRKGEINQEQIDNLIKRLLRIYVLTGLIGNKGDNEEKEDKILSPDHIKEAREIAEEGIILLQNRENILPIIIEREKRKQESHSIRKIFNRIFILGPNANKKMANGGGSSEVNPPYEITPLQGILDYVKEKKIKIDLIYSSNIGERIEKRKGKGKEEEISLYSKITEQDLVIYIGGLNHDRFMDGEGRDRKTFLLPDQQYADISMIRDKTEKIIFVLVNGSPVDLNAIGDQVQAIIEMWYAGMEGGNALAKIIFGEIAPSGKLPITFPKSLSDVPAHESKKTYPGKKKVFYKEDIFIGYRWYEMKKIPVMFPFGHGLSYTSFEYSDLKISVEENKILVRYTIKNIGNMVGKEIGQIYIGASSESDIPRPLKELKAFIKVELKPNEQKEIIQEIDFDSLRFFHPITNKWTFSKGIYKIFVGSSSADIRLSDEIELK